MSGIAFLIMLGSFAFLLYWYVLNVEQDKDGTSGLLQLDEEDLATEELRVSSLAKQVNWSAPRRHLQNVRRRARQAQTQSQGLEDKGLESPDHKHVDDVNLQEQAENLRRQEESDKHYRARTTKTVKVRSRAADGPSHGRGVDEEALVDLEKIKAARLGTQKEKGVVPVVSTKDAKPGSEAKEATAETKYRSRSTAKPYRVID